MRIKSGEGDFVRLATGLANLFCAVYHLKARIVGLTGYPFRWDKNLPGF
jgi:hypothetical protein